MRAESASSLGARVLAIMILAMTMIMRAACDQAYSHVVRHARLLGSSRRDWWS